MYRIFTIQSKVRVPPEMLSTNVKEAVKKALEEQLEGKIDARLGVILAVVSVEEVGEGKILPGDAGVHYQAKYKLLAYKPEVNELVWGEVIDNTEFGSFVRIGPLDGLVHISQLMDDFVSYDAKNALFLGKQTKKTLKEGDKVRARVIAVSLGKEENKIGLTMRQAGLGALHWLEEEKKKKKKGK
ncbi:MAG: DNA-directed RNA polymerase [Candidatus Aenigmatarchaeota archaeon]|nr:MAG: DNA-directed RNA polymerase [Candidatus Aenigmarchaeota archaeon]